MQKSPSARPTPEAVMVGSVWPFVYQLRSQNRCCCCCYFLISLSLSLWMLDTSIHRIKWWRKCGHYIHVGVSSARTEKITWPKLGLANFRIILKASAFLFFLIFLKCIAEFDARWYRNPYKSYLLRSFYSNTRSFLIWAIMFSRNLLFIGTFFIFTFLPCVQ